MSDTTIQNIELDPEPAGTLVLRLLLAKIQNDDELQDLQIRRLTAGGTDALLDAVKRLSYDMTVVLRGMYGIRTEGILLEILNREVHLS